ncbi:MAG: hypothetical protein SFX73_36115 [Kofleriaceae bacterium]|nr:hypothetical protein [Kofleriaceae bacterium]
MIEIDQESDRVPVRPIRWSAILVTATIAVSIVATLALARRRLMEPPVEDRRPAQIDSSLFVEPTEAEQLRFQADLRLDSYGWADRARGLIHVPLDVAIDHYLETKP